MDGKNPEMARGWLHFHRNHVPHTPIDQPRTVDARLASFGDQLLRAKAAGDHDAIRSLLDQMQAEGLLAAPT